MHYTHTHTTERRFETRSRLACRGVVAFVFMGCLPDRANGGCSYLKRAKKYSAPSEMCCSAAGQAMNCEW